MIATTGPSFLRSARSLCQHHLEVPWPATSPRFLATANGLLPPCNRPRCQTLGGLQSTTMRQATRGIRAATTGLRWHYITEDSPSLSPPRRQRLTPPLPILMVRKKYHRAVGYRPRPKRTMCPSLSVGRPKRTESNQIRVRNRLLR
jgi:hypothetical protein